MPPAEVDVAVGVVAVPGRDDVGVFDPEPRAEPPGLVGDPPGGFGGPEAAPLLDDWDSAVFEAVFLEDEPHPARATAPPAPTSAASRVRRSTVRMASEVTGNMQASIADAA